MRLPHKLLIFCFLAFCNTLSSQSVETINLRKRLQWTENKSSQGIAASELNFEESVPSSDFDNLPSIVHREALKKFGRINSVRITPLQTEYVNSNIAHSGLSRLTGEWQYEAKITYRLYKKYKDPEQY